MRTSNSASGSNGKTSSDGIPRTGRSRDIRCQRSRSFTKLPRLDDKNSVYRRAPSHWHARIRSGNDHDHRQAPFRSLLRTRTINQIQNSRAPSGAVLSKDWPLTFLPLRTRQTISGTGDHQSDRHKGHQNGHSRCQDGLNGRTLDHQSQNTRPCNATGDDWTNKGRTGQVIVNATKTERW